MEALRSLYQKVNTQALVNPIASYAPAVVGELLAAQDTLANAIAGVTLA